MKARNKKANFIIIFIIVLLLILLILIKTLLIALEKQVPESGTNVTISSGEAQNKNPKTIKEIIENSGSIYLGIERSVYLEIYTNFKNDLYDKNGRSNEKYFNDIIEQIVNLEKTSFYLIDNDKNLKIFVFYDKEKDKYTITINDVQDFYDETDGQTYVNIENTNIVQQNAMAVSEDLYSSLQLNSMKYANTAIVTSEREQLPNGYYVYPNEHIKAKLQGPKVLNLIYDKEYEAPIVGNTIFANTKLEDIEAKYKNPGFGSAKEGYLGYRTLSDYVFFYGDEVSVYSYKYQENEYFDQYLKDYCETGDLDKLVKDFTTRWTTYFEFEYDAENQNLKLTFPTRGIAMNIIGNDSKGITIYNNYCLTDTVKELIKNNKITLEPNKDLILITEQNRRESMK